MCRSIKVLRGRGLPSADPANRESEARAASLQFVRKVSGYRVPSRRNAAAFDQAVEEITASVKRMLAAMPENQPEAKAAAQDQENRSSTLSINPLSRG
jgi:hypothetical protein